MIYYQSSTSLRVSAKVSTDPAHKRNHHRASIQNFRIISAHLNYNFELQSVCG